MRICDPCAESLGLKLDRPFRDMGECRVCGNREVCNHIPRENVPDVKVPDRLDLLIEEEEPREQEPVDETGNPIAMMIRGILGEPQHAKLKMMLGRMPEVVFPAPAYQIALMDDSSESSNWILQLMTRRGPMGYLTRVVVLDVGYMNPAEHPGMLMAAALDKMSKDYGVSNKEVLEEASLTEFGHKMMEHAQSMDECVDLEIQRMRAMTGLPMKWAKYIQDLRVAIRTKDNLPKDPMILMFIRINVLARLDIHRFLRTLEHLGHKGLLVVVEIDQQSLTSRLVRFHASRLLSLPGDEEASKYRGEIENNVWHDLHRYVLLFRD